MGIFMQGILLAQNILGICKRAGLDIGFSFTDSSVDKGDDIEFGVLDLDVIVEGRELIP